MRKRIAQIALTVLAASFVFFGLFTKTLCAEDNPMSGRVDLDIRSAGGEWTPDDNEADPGVFLLVNDGDDSMYVYLLPDDDEDMVTSGDTLAEIHEGRTWSTPNHSSITTCCEE